MEETTWGKKQFLRYGTAGKVKRNIKSTCKPLDQWPPPAGLPVCPRVAGLWTREAGPGPALALGFVVSQWREAGLTRGQGPEAASDVSVITVSWPGPGFSLFYKTIDPITSGFVALKRAVKIRTSFVCDN